MPKGRASGCFEILERARVSLSRPAAEPGLLSDRPLDILEAFEGIVLLAVVEAHRSEASRMLIVIRPAIEEAAPLVTLLRYCVRLDDFVRMLEERSVRSFVRTFHPTALLIKEDEYEFHAALPLSKCRSSPA